MRIISLNLNGIRSATTKGALQWLGLQQADVICVQELKAQEADLTDAHLSVIHNDRVMKGHFYAAQKKGYSGVGLYSEANPSKITRGIGIAEFDQEGRVLRADFDRADANDGEIGEQFLREFQDNEKTIPTILTTSQKLSTGVDARNIRNIVLMRPVNSMIEFKQIVGRGTRLFDGKEFFTIYDYVDAFHHFADPEWDGEPEEPVVGGPGLPKPPCSLCGQRPCVCEKAPKEPCGICGELNCNCNKKQKIKIKLRDGKEREIQSMIATSFWSAEGKPISAEEFLNNLFGELPNLFTSEEELRTLWSNPLTRRTLLEKLEEAGFPKSDLLIVQQLVNMEKSDLFDVLEYVFNGNYKSMTREERVATSQATIFALLDSKQKEFIEFVLSKYIETGVEELDQEKLPILLTNKYQSLEDAKEILGDVANISRLFIEFQQHLYKRKSA